MGPEHLKKAGKAVETLAKADREFNQAYVDRRKELDRRAASLDTPQALEFFITVREAAYARMHGLLHALWRAPDSDTLLPPRSDGANGLERPVQVPGYPELVLHTDSEVGQDPEAEHNYGLAYKSGDFRQPLQGLGGERLIYSDTEISLRNTRELDDPRGGYGYPEDSAANFLENVDTLERLCEAAGVPMPETVPSA